MFRGRKEGGDPPLRLRFGRRQRRKWWRGERKDARPGLIAGRQAAQQVYIFGALRVALIPALHHIFFKFIDQKQHWVPPLPGRPNLPQAKAAHGL